MSITTTDCYTAIAMKGSALDLKLQKMVKNEYLEKHTSMIVLTVEQFKKVVGDAFTAGEECGLTESYNFEWGDKKEVVNKTGYIATLLT